MGGPGTPRPEEAQAHLERPREAQEGPARSGWGERGVLGEAGHREGRGAPGRRREEPWEEQERSGGAHGRERAGGLEGDGWRETPGERREPRESWVPGEAERKKELIN